MVRGSTPFFTVAPSKTDNIRQIGIRVALQYASEQVVDVGAYASWYEPG
jgi:hypothetical protein